MARLTSQRKRVQERGRGVVVDVMDSTAEFAELVLILAGALFYGTVTFENSTTSI